MSTPVLATKLYIPPPRPKIVLRPRLLAPLNEGLHRKLTLLSAPAGFGKTTILSEWIACFEHRDPRVRAAWVSLDEGDNDPARFLTYFVAALEMIGGKISAQVWGAIQSPQLPPVEPILTTLLNDIAAIPDPFILVLDDYHVIEARPVDEALAFLLKHLPPQMHLVLLTREDPDLPFARLRARNQLTELRAADLRFTLPEAASFLTQAMELKLSAPDIAALETRTEGWIAGLQLAALALQGLPIPQPTSSEQTGHADLSRFIQSFTGSHRFIMDYLVEEVLQQQPENIQRFLLSTSILERLSGPLCEAVLHAPAGTGQETLEYLERANLFTIPLDNERRWYRYHHLFADLLQQRLSQQNQPRAFGVAHEANALHLRASQWFEDNGFDLEAFKHAAAAQDVTRTEYLIEKGTLPLQFSGTSAVVLNWLASIPKPVMDARPTLWWRYAALLLVNGQTTGVEEKLQGAEAALAANALPGNEANDQTRNLIGQIAAARATLALTRYDAEMMVSQSRRALEYLSPQSLFTRSNAYWTLGTAYLLQGDRSTARHALTEAIALAKTAGAMFTMVLATIALGNVQEADNQLNEAAQTYQLVLQWVGDQPQQIIHEAHLGLARIRYQWNDLETAQKHAEQALQLARQYERHIDRFVLCEIFLVRLKLAQGDVSGAAAILTQTARSSQELKFVHRLPEVAAAQVLVLLRQGNISGAAQRTEAYPLPLSRARVLLAQGDAPTARSVLEAYRHITEANRWEDERLKALVLEAVAYHGNGETDRGVQRLEEALALAEPGGFIRLFVDEGSVIAGLLAEASAQGIRPAYVANLLAAFETEKQKGPERIVSPSAQPLIEPLSQRELEVLHLVAQGLSNLEIGERLYLSENTVKGHNQKIFGKLQVQRRTEAVARARALGLL